MTSLGFENLSFGYGPKGGPADYGIMVHYLGGGWPEHWNHLVDTFDVEGLAQDLEEAGAGHLLFSLGQNSGFYCAPNSTYDSIVGHSPSHCSRRDLLIDLYEALSKRGIKLLAYLPSNAPEDDEVARRKLKYDEGLPRRAEFQKMWESIIREWSLQWGDRIAGWWFDGCYHAQEMYAHPDPPNFESFAAAARAGNPDASVSFNNGQGAVPMSKCEDCTAGEVWQRDRFLPECSPGGVVNNRDPVTKEHYQTKWHLLTFLAGNFGGFGVPDLPRFNDQYVVSYMLRQLSTGGSLTWDVPIVMGGEENGRLRRRLMPQLRAIKGALRPSTNLASNRAVIASSRFEKAEGPIQIPPTLWTSADHDQNPYWQVDLGLAHSLQRVEIVLGSESVRDNLEIRATNNYDCANSTVIGSLPLGKPLPDVLWTVTLPSQAEKSPQGHCFLRLQKAVNSPGKISIAEIRIFGSSLPPVNLALYKPATASSGSDPALGNNGKIDTNWESNGNDSGAWWQVDLGEEYQVWSVELLAKQGSSEEYARRHFQVWGSSSGDFVSPFLLASNGEYTLPNNGLWTAPVGTLDPVRYVRVVKTDGNPFVFSEVRVFGHSPLGFCVASSERPAWASSAWNSDQGAKKATQENPDTMWAAGPNDMAPWWEVDLGRPLRVLGVEMTARQDDCDQPPVRSLFEIWGNSRPDGIDGTLLAAQGVANFPYKATWRAPVSDQDPHRYIRVVKSDRTHINFATLRVIAETPAPVKDPEVAAGRPASASSIFSEGVESENGNDGKKDTVWASAVGDKEPWWQVDLGGTFLICQVALTARQDGDQSGARKSFEVRGSNDEGNRKFCVLAKCSEQGFPARATWQAPADGEEPVRFLRVVKVDGAHFNFCEFKAFGTSPFPSDLSSGASASSSSHWESCPPQNALDDISTHIWASAANDAQPWWQVDLGDLCIVTSVEVTARQDGDQDFARRDFSILGSTTPDFSSSTPLATPAPPPFPPFATWRARVASLDPYRYLRVAKADGSHFNFAKFKAYGSRPLRDEVTQGCQAKASSVFSQGVGPEKALDGIPYTIWASALEDPQPWWQVDLGQPCSIVKVEIRSRQDGDQDFARRSFEVRGSNNMDGSASTLLAAQGEVPFENLGTWSSYVQSSAPFHFLRVVKVDGSHFNFSGFKAFGYVEGS